MEYHYIKDNTAQVAGSALDQLLGEYHGHPILLLLSGGSSLSLLPYIKKERLGPHMTLSMLDERYTKKATDQNFSQMMDSFFFKTATDLRLPTIDTRPEGNEGLAETTERIRCSFREWESKAGGAGAIIATAGIGEDGHIAGVLPDKENEKEFMLLFNDPRQTIVGYERTGAEHPCRISATLNFLQSRTAGVIVYAVGKEKINAIIRVRAEKGTLAETPARILNDIPNSHLFTDIKA
jgi:6-phosphogluconolactonase/glucosamine-6-phosphate isomerase/deaminase